jgi:hypothetical protein
MEQAVKIWEAFLIKDKVLLRRSTPRPNQRRWQRFLYLKKYKSRLTTLPKRVQPITHHGKYRSASF